MATVGRLIAIAISSWTGSALAQDCPNRADLLDRAEEAVLEFRLADVDSYIAGTEAALACGSVIGRTDAVRWHQLVGMRLYLDEQRRPEARAAFAIAKQLGGHTLNEVYGEDPVPFYSGATTSDHGDLQVRGVPAEWGVWVDGVPLAGPILAGPHFVQVGPSGASMRWSAFLFTSTDEATLRVPTLDVRADPQDRLQGTAADRSVGARTELTLGLVGLGGGVLMRTSKLLGWGVRTWFGLQAVVEAGVPVCRGDFGGSASGSRWDPGNCSRGASGEISNRLDQSSWRVLPVANVEIHAHIPFGRDWALEPGVGPAAFFQRHPGVFVLPRAGVSIRKTLEGSIDAQLAVGAAPGLGLGYLGYADASDGGAGNYRPIGETIYRDLQLDRAEVARRVALAPDASIRIGIAF